MTHWFLNPVIPGHPDAWCTQALGTGPIRVYTSYQEYYGRLITLISSARKNDEIFLVGWDLRVHALLMEKDTENVLERLRKARRDGARVRLLATAHNTDWSDNENQMKLAAAGDDNGNFKLEALLDTQLEPDTSHHQKAAFFRLGSNKHLLLGGMDIAFNRIGIWYDVQAEVMGQAAELGRITLEERWDSVTGRTPGKRSVVVESKDEDQHRVQFIRTYQPVGKKPPAANRNFAAEGEHTYYMLLSHAIGAAQRSIYLEEQFMFSMGEAPVRTETFYKFPPTNRADIPGKPRLLEDKLLEAIQERGVKVVVVGPNFDSNSRTDLNFRIRRKFVVDRLSKAKTEKDNRPELLKVRAGMPFVHSKTWIFDDDFVVIGSGNFWEQSMVNTRGPAESEFGIAFTSKKAGFARALRITLWERIRRTIDPQYKFPLKEGARLLDEIEELKKPIGGVSPLLPMP